MKLTVVRVQIKFLHCVYFNFLCLQYQQKSGRGTSYETQPGTMQDMNVEETEEKGEHAQSEFETPVRPGILTRIARLV